MQITCHLTGVSFDPENLSPNPIRCIPGTRLPADRGAVDTLYPVPAKSDARYEEKAIARAQALADVATYASTHAAAVKAAKA
jgi:hypothetical protein